MTSGNAVERRPDTDYRIVVNAQRKVVEDEVVSFAEIVELAFPGGSTDPNTTYTITFRKAKEPREGVLAEGGTVEVRREGTIFNVTQTIKS